MRPNDSAGRIHKVAFLAACTTLFAISLLFTIARTALRLHYQRRLFIDDALLFFAVLCHCVAMVFLYIIVEPLISDAFVILSYTALYAVKFSLLFLFRTLVRRIPNMVIFWRVVVAITGVAWVVSSISAWLPCLYYDIRSLYCAEKPGVSKIIGLVTFVVMLDIVTDIMIMMIPIYLLWHVQTTLQQKAVLGACLCLSIMTIFTSVIRVSGIRFYQDKSDLVWQIFWQASETAIAITMVSLSAFRSFFIAHESRSRVHRNRPGYMSRKKPLPASIQKRRLGIDSHEMEKLPHIPRATLTGMRTFIRGKTHSAELIMRTEQTSDGSDSHLVSYEVNPENSR